MTKEQFNVIKSHFGLYDGAKVSCKLGGLDNTKHVTGIIRDWGEGSYSECLIVSVKGRKKAIHYERLELVLERSLEDYFKNGIKITQESLDNFKAEAEAWRNQD